MQTDTQKVLTGTERGERERGWVQNGLDKLRTRGGGKYKDSHNLALDLINAGSRSSSQVCSKCFIQNMRECAPSYLGSLAELDELDSIRRKEPNAKGSCVMQPDEAALQTLSQFEIGYRCTVVIQSSIPPERVCANRVEMSDVSALTDLQLSKWMRYKRAGEDRAKSAQNGEGEKGWSVEGCHQRFPAKYRALAYAYIFPDLIYIPHIYISKWMSKFCLIK